MAIDKITEEKMSAINLNIIGAYINQSLTICLEAKTVTFTIRTTSNTVSFITELKGVLDYFSLIPDESKKIRYLYH